LDPWDGCQCRVRMMLGQVHTSLASNAEPYLCTAAATVLSAI
jgi:hypothetical protein